MWIFRVMDWVFNEFQDFLELVMSGNWATFWAMLLFLAILGIVAYIKKSIF